MQMKWYCCRHHRRRHRCRRIAERCEPNGIFYFEFVQTRQRWEKKKFSKQFLVSAYEIYVCVCGTVQRRHFLFFLFRFFFFYSARSPFSMAFGQFPVATHTYKHMRATVAMTMPTTSTAASKWTEFTSMVEDKVDGTGHTCARHTAPRKASYRRYTRLAKIGLKKLCTRP